MANKKSRIPGKEAIRGAPNQASKKSDRELIAGLAKGMAIIEAFEMSRSSLTVTRAANLAGLSRAAARRCLRTFQQLGYAETDGDHFLLTPRTLRLSQAYVVSNPLPRVVQPIIEATSQQMRHSMTVAVQDGTEAVIIARTLMNRVLAGGMALGTRLPIYCSANGRLLISELPATDVQALLQRINLKRLTQFTKVTVSEILKELRTIRAQGYAINDQEVEPGVRSIAIPVRNRQGEIVCTVSMAARIEIADRQYLMKMLPDLDTARRRISSAL